MVPSNILLCCFGGNKLAWNFSVPKAVHRALIYTIELHGVLVILLSKGRVRSCYRVLDHSKNMVCHNIYLKFIKAFEIFDMNTLQVEKLGNQGIHLNFQIEN